VLLKSIERLPVGLPRHPGFKCHPEWGVILAFHVILSGAKDLSTQPRTHRFLALLRMTAVGRILRFAQNNDVSRRDPPCRGNRLMLVSQCAYVAAFPQRGTSSGAGYPGPSGYAQRLACHFRLFL